MGVGGERHAVADLHPGKTRYIVQVAGWPQGRSGQVRKISLPPGFNPQTTQPVVSCYIDWDIPAHKVISVRDLIWSIWLWRSMKEYYVISECIKYIFFFSRWGFWNSKFKILLEHVIWGSLYEWKIYTRCMDSLAGVCLFGRFLQNKGPLLAIEESGWSPLLIWAFWRTGNMHASAGNWITVTGLPPVVPWSFSFPGDVRSERKMLFWWPGRQVRIAWCH
jgi:hypothetical protein